MLRFVLVTLRAAYPVNMSCKLQFRISARFEVSKNSIFNNSSRNAQMVCFVLVTLIAAKPADLTSMQRF